MLRLSDALLTVCGLVLLVTLPFLGCTPFAVVAIVAYLASWLAVIWVARSEIPDPSGVERCPESDRPDRLR